MVSVPIVLVIKDLKIMDKIVEQIIVVMTKFLPLMAVVKLV